jgi:cardiolipin synthase
MLNAPNFITLLRVLLVPALLYFLTQQSYLQALLVFIAAGLSDALDGFLARRLNQFTRFGAILDPVADKLMIVSALVMLTWQAQIPMWLTLALLLRDLVIISGALAYRLRAGSLEMAPTFLGKTHIALVFMLLALVMGSAAEIAGIASALPALFALTLVTGIVSGAQYVWVWGNKAAKL